MRRSIRAGILAALVVAPLGGASSQVVHPTAIPVDLNVPVAPRPINGEGIRHLIYELHITNFGREELVLRKIEILGDSAVIASVEGDSLSGLLARPGSSALADKRVIGPGLRAVAFLDAAMPVGTKTPRTISHRLTFQPVTPPNSALQSVVSGGITRVSAPIAMIVGPPVSGNGWIALHGLSNQSVHRRTLLAIDGHARIAQRFAIDWTHVGADGQVFHGDPARNSNWVPYGEPVLAVHDGRVVEVQDGIPENDPTSDRKAVPITLQTVGGNYVILDLGSGVYAFYAHLQPGTLCVKGGDWVKRGQVLAKLGNSGQADAPHLHLHFTDAPSPLAAEGIPVAFESFEIEGHLASTKVLVDGTGWHATGNAVQVQREMPIENAVVGFGVARPTGCGGQK